MKFLQALSLLLLSVVAYATNSCLDPSSDNYKCSNNTGTQIVLDDCGIVDTDLEDVATCMDFFGRDTITRVYLRYNSLTTIQATLFQGLGKLERIYLSHNFLEVLPVKVFEGLERLQWLYLDANALSFLSDGIFQQLGQLQRLSFDQNSLTTLPAEIFSALDGLQELSLTNNPGLQCVPASSATTVDVDEDVTGLCGCFPAEAVMCPDGVFCMPGELGYSCATPAPSQSPTPAPFTPVPTSMPTPAKNPCLDPNSGSYMCNMNGTEIHLDYCGIADNDLNDVSACLDVFGRGTMKRVYLRFNYLVNLPEDMFEGLGQVERVYLNNNALSSLPAEIFQSLGMLDTLNLNGNPLTSLPGGLFQGLGQLQQLWINQGLLTTLPAELFGGLGQLESLDLRLNPDLQCIPENVATTVDVSEQSLGGCGCSLSPSILCDTGETCMPGEFGYSCATPSPTPAPAMPGNNTCLDPTNEAYVCNSRGSEVDFSFCGIMDDNLDEVAACMDVFGRDKITHVYLRYNYLSRVPADLFKDCHNLEHLYLNDNALSTVPSELFHGLGMLQIVNMNRNSLYSLPGNLFQQHSNGTALGTLQGLWLNQNMLTTLPAEIFEGLGMLQTLDLRLNADLQCIPNNSAVTLSVDNGASYEMCECTPTRAVMCTLGQVCAPGEFGYTCVG